MSVVVEGKGIQMVLVDFLVMVPTYPLSPPPLYAGPQNLRTVLVIGWRDDLQ